MLRRLLLTATIVASLAGIASAADNILSLSCPNSIPVGKIAVSEVLTELDTGTTLSWEVYPSSIEHTVVSGGKGLVFYSPSPCVASIAVACLHDGRLLLATHAITVGEPGPDPPNPPSPDLSDSAQAIYDCVKANFAIPDYPVLLKLADNYRLTAIDYAEYSDLQDMLDKVRDLNTKAIEKAEQPEKFDPMFEAITNLFNALYDDDKLANPADMASAFEEVSYGMKEACK